ncbi:LRR domain containing protein, partial [Parasponia andersonii]
RKNGLLQVASNSASNKSGHVIELDLSFSDSAFNDSDQANRLPRGDISSSLVELPYLKCLDLSGIDFGGSRIPSFLGALSKLRYLRLSNAEIVGEIPPQLGNLSSLEIETLYLGYNNLTGDIPSSLMNCTELVVLDVGENKLSGHVPTWISNIPNLVILSLRSNHFYRSIPSSLFEVLNLQLLDLSSNNLSRSLPNCLGNFTTMKTSGSVEMNIEHEYLINDDAFGAALETYEDEILLMWKGKLSKYGCTLRLVKSIDLLSKNIVGEIPREITERVELRAHNSRASIGMRTWEILNYVEIHSQRSAKEMKIKNVFLKILIKRQMMKSF